MQLNRLDVLPVVQESCCAQAPAAQRADTSETGKQAPRLASLYLRLVRSFSLLSRDRVCCGEVTVQQCYTLALLRQDGPHAMQQLADALGLALSTATRNVDVLERRGDVERSRSLEDGRIVLVQLTEQGQALAGRLMEDEAACCAQLLELIPQQRRENLLLALDDLVRANDTLRQQGDSSRPDACFP